MIVASYDEILAQLHENSFEITASALLTKDGVMLASRLPSEKEDILAAMSAAVLSLSNRMSEELLGNFCERITIKTHLGYVFVAAATNDIVLTVLAHPEARIGMIFHDIQNASRQLQTLIYGIY